MNDRSATPNDGALHQGAAVHVRGNRCPMCHDDVVPRESVVCQVCLARHHDPCWHELGRCGACGADRPLRLDEARGHPRRATRPGPRPPHPAAGLVLGVIAMTLLRRGVWIGAPVALVAFALLALSAAAWIRAGDPATKG